MEAGLIKNMLLTPGRKWLFWKIKATFPYWDYTFGVIASACP
jgi:hypothetical protein